MVRRLTRSLGIGIGHKDRGPQKISQEGNQSSESGQIFSFQLAGGEIIKMMANSLAAETEECRMKEIDIN